MAPFCTHCLKEMICEKIGVVVAPENVPTHQYRGDLFRCMGCGARIVAGLAGPFHDKETDPDYLFKQPPMVLGDPTDLPLAPT